MDLYLFPTLHETPAIRRLLQLREGGVERHSLYPDLFAFACDRAYTTRTVRELVLRQMLRRPPARWDSGLMLPYLRQDIQLVYDIFFDTDWDQHCRDAGLLPLPEGRAANPPGEQPYRDLLSDMVESGSAGALADAVAGFLDRFRDEDEAMYRAFHWDGGLTGVDRPDPITFDDLWGLEHQKQAVLDNTRAFVEGRAANDMLLIGGSGTGKSSCVKAVLNRFAAHGLKLAEIPNSGLAGLSALMRKLAGQRCKYLVFIDDLSFETADQRYLALKTTLDGQVAGRPDNVLIYATSNRRHLVRESWKDRDREEDIHENDTVHEKLSLSERFGVRLYFPTLGQREYLDVVAKLLVDKGAAFTDSTAIEAAAWAAQNNGRSGRSARQFVRHFLSK